MTWPQKHLARRQRNKIAFAALLIGLSLASKRLQKFKYCEGERRQNERKPRFCKPTQAPDAKRSHCVRHQRQSVRS